MENFSKFLQDNSTLLISFLTILLSSIVTIATLLLNLKNNLRIKKAEHFHEIALREFEYASNRKSKIFEDYLNALLGYANEDNTQNKNEYKKAYGCALLYANNSARFFMETLDSQIENKNTNSQEFHDTLNALCDELQKEIYKSVNPN